jgi:CO/xanthine dehydrogenase Mo-binding subunit
MDPIELRRRNGLRSGDETITGQKVEHGVGFLEVLDRAEEVSEWAAKRALFSRDGGPVRRGIGAAAAFCGLGPGPAGRPLGDGAGASIVVSADGSVTIATGTVDTGDGESTAFAQIAADVLGCPLEKVRVADVDTSRLPDGPPAAARGGTWSAEAVRDAASRVRSALDEAAGSADLPWQEAVALAAHKKGPLAGYGWSAPPEGGFDLAAGQGAPHACYAFSAAVAEVEVDIETAEVRVVRVTSSVDVGRAVNPASEEGVVEGGVLMGLGLALFEENIFADGRVRNDRFSTYLLPTALDAPEVRVALVENPCPFGPFGAKGLADAPVLPVAPAVSAAIAQATGIRVSDLPATAERIWAARRSKP